MNKLNKKGFTLIELLAVIAILAILLMLVLPSTLNLYTKGRKQSFVMEVQSVMRTASDLYVAAELTGDSKGPYSNVKGCQTTNSAANIQGFHDSEKPDLKYYIQFNDKGLITHVLVTDGTFKYDSGKVEAGMGLDIGGSEDNKNIKDATKDTDITCTSADEVKFSDDN